MIIKFKKKKIRINVRKINNPYFSFGLMFKGKNTKNLLFDLSTDRGIDLTSLFVFFPFVVVWLDNSNNVIEWKLVKPFNLKVGSPKSFSRFVEIPLNRKNKKIFDFLVGRKGLNI